MGKIIVITGPTGSGKTNLAVRVAKTLNTEIISADSRQIYKKLNIGTDKPSLSVLSEVKHHLIDEFEPVKNFNAGIFVELSRQIINKLHSQNKIPIITGGTGLYIKALVDGIINSVDTDVNIRKELLEKRKVYGNEYLYNELKKVDKKSADNMIPQNWKRVIRALEVYYISGKPIWQHFEDQSYDKNNTFFQFALEWERKILYKRIEARIDRMIKNGLVDEVKFLMQSGYSKELNALNTVGYKEIISYLENQISIERAVELIKRNSRHYAKRQLTWFKSDDRIEWIKISSESEFSNAANLILKKVLNERKN